MKRLRRLSLLLGPLMVVLMLANIVAGISPVEAARSTGSSIGKTAGIQTAAACPTDASAITSMSVKITRGGNTINQSNLANIQPGDKVRVTFDLNDSCSSYRVSLVSYKAPDATNNLDSLSLRVVNSQHSSLFNSAGGWLEVTAPNCYHATVFAVGSVLTTMNASTTYGSRQKDTGNGGSSTCAGVAAPTPKYFSGTSTNCAAVGSQYGETWAEYVVNSAPTNTTYTLASGGHKVTVSGSGSTGFNWSSTGTALKGVLLKSSGGTNLYRWASGSFSGSGMKSVGKPDGSMYNITSAAFCFAPIPTTAVCPEGKSAITAYRFEIWRGGSKIDTTDLNNVQVGDLVKAYFDLAPGCSNIQLSIPSYEAPEPYYDVNTVHLQEYVPYTGDTGLFSASQTAAQRVVQSLVPGCYFQIDFVYGPIIEQLTPSNLYGNNKIAWKNGGNPACGSRLAPTMTNTPNATTTKQAEQTATKISEQTGTSVAKTQTAIAPPTQTAVSKTQTAVANTATSVSKTQTVIANQTGTSVAKTATFTAGQTSTSVAITQTVVVQQTGTATAKTATAGAEQTATTTASTATSTAKTATAGAEQTGTVVAGTATSTAKTATAGAEETGTVVAGTATSTAKTATAGAEETGTSIALTTTAQPAVTQTEIAKLTQTAAPGVTQTANANNTSTAAAESATSVVKTETASANQTGTVVAGTATAAAETATHVAGVTQTAVIVSQTSVAATATHYADVTNTAIAITATHVVDQTNTAVAKTETAEANGTATQEAIETGTAEAEETATWIAGVTETWVAGVTETAESITATVVANATGTSDASTATTEAQTATTEAIQTATESAKQTQTATANLPGSLIIKKTTNNEAGAPVALFGACFDVFAPTNYEEPMLNVCDNDANDADDLEGTILLQNLTPTNGNGYGYMIVETYIRDGYIMDTEEKLVHVWGNNFPTIGEVTVFNAIDTENPPWTNVMLYKLVCDDQPSEPELAAFVEHETIPEDCQLGAEGTTFQFEILDNNGQLISTEIIGEDGGPAIFAVDDEVPSIQVRETGMDNPLITSQVGQIVDHNGSIHCPCGASSIVVVNEWDDAAVAAATATAEALTPEP